MYGKGRAAKYCTDLKQFIGLGSALLNPYVWYVI